ncbi:hypothetical protein ACFT9I_15385 [Streptomyces sp. NPDC057137]|uniref:hypothetical protein n=1 Tax=Streptomyces sp. NPDC057137 TaxID=3346030 RepID=UPI00363B4859
MTYPPNVRTAPVPAPTHAPAPSAPPPVPPPAPRGAWAEGRERLRAAATTEPGRLQIIGALLALLVVVFGAVTAFEVSDRYSSADDVVERSQPLSAVAAKIYGSLASADTAASSGFLAGAQEPATVQKVYRDDIRTASELLIDAATSTDSSSDSGRQIATINEQLPRYTGLIERARANNRQGLPLGGAYLRYANQLMTKEILPAAEKLYASETARLDRDHEDARVWPFLALAAGVVALGVLAWAQRRNYLRTNRVFNHGLLAATAAATVVLLWLAVGHTVARVELNNASADGQASLKVLNDARISSLKARASENLTLVARGAVLTEKKGDEPQKDQYEVDHQTHMKNLGDALAKAKKLADDDAGRLPVAKAREEATEWQKRHKSANDTDKAGEYDAAVEKVIAEKDSTGETFGLVDSELEKAITHEQAEFTDAAKSGRGALFGLAIGALALGLLGAVCAILGINRRLSEYR